jgi:methylmalonyl-CoA/ethylmalonyl-CoA epimerase
MSLKFHHIGIACRNIQEQLDSLTLFHNVVEISPIIFDAEQNAEICMVKTREGVLMELISGQQVVNILRKGIAYYHICFETNDIVSEISRLQDSGALVISEAKPAIMFGDRHVAFLQVSYGLIELLQA